jgi:DNA-binding NarL/FixJ family response regulator
MFSFIVHLRLKTKPLGRPGSDAGLPNVRMINCASSKMMMRHERLWFLIFSIDQIGRWNGSLFPVDFFGRERMVHRRFDDFVNQAASVFTDSESSLTLMECINRETESDACTILAVDKSNQTIIRVDGLGYDESIYRIYNEEYYRYDITVPIGLTFQPHDPFIIDDHVEAKAIDHNPIYQDLIIPSGFRWLAGAKAVDDRDTLLLLGLHRHAARRRFTAEDDFRVMRMVSNVLASAARTGRVINDLRSKLAAVSNAMDRLAAGIVVVDADRRVRHLNEAARRSLDRRVPLRIVDGRLTASATAGADWVAKAIRAAATIKQHEARSFLTPEGESVTASIAAAGVVEQGLWGGERPIAVVVIDDPRDRPRNIRSRLAKAFALTTAEADVLSAMMEGLTAEEIAARRSVAVTTVRSQIRQIMMKMGVNRSTQAVMRAGAALWTRED